MYDRLVPMVGLIREMKYQNAQTFWKVRISLGWNLIAPKSPFQVLSFEPSRYPGAVYFKSMRRIYGSLHMTTFWCMHLGREGEFICFGRLRRLFRSFQQLVSQIKYIDDVTHLASMDSSVPLITKRVHLYRCSDHRKCEGVIHTGWSSCADS